MMADGLNLSKLNVRHGGKQPKMRQSIITPDLLGPFHSQVSPLQPGMYQSMFFASDDQGPCYYNLEEREIHRLDINKGGSKEKEMTIEQLKNVLKGAGDPNPKGNKSRLMTKCKNLGLPTLLTEDNVDEGWVGKAKGSLQILFERGWINPDCIHLYTAKGKKSSVIHLFPPDPTGCNYSIDGLMQLQTDFKNEMTLLEYHVRSLGVILDRTPKCHPELAGEGIEYAWALAKLFYRRALMSKKRSKELFKQLVESSTDPSSFLNITRLRSCSKKARMYMKLYSMAVEEIVLTDETVNRHSVLEDSVKLYLKLKKKGKTHRSVLDRN